MTEAVPSGDEDVPQAGVDGLQDTVLARQADEQWRHRILSTEFSLVQADLVY